MTEPAVNRGTIVTGVLALLAVAIAGGLLLQQRDGPPLPETPAVATTDNDPQDAAPEVAPQSLAEPASDPAPQTAETEPEPEAPDPEPAALDPPGIDVVRVEPDGTTVLAGTGPAGGTVTVLLDDTKLEELSVDSSGSFVGFFTLPPSEDPRVLTLLARTDGQEARSEDEIILAPQPQSGPDASADTAQAGSGDTDAPETTPPTDAIEADAPEPAGPTALAEAPLPEAGAPGAAATAPAPKPEVGAAPEAVAVLRADPEGVELLQPAEPDTDDTLRLDTISYSAEGQVQLSGRAAAGALIRAYLDNTAIGDLLTDNRGRWRGELSDVAPGIYVLRLDALDSAGQVIGRLETPFQREAPEALAAAIAPSAGQETAETGATQAPEAGTAIPADLPPVRAITVQTGDTLWAISRDRYGDGVLYVRVFEANRDSIRDPDLIYPGQVFALPED